MDFVDRNGEFLDRLDSGAGSIWESLRFATFMTFIVRQLMLQIFARLKT